MAKAKVRSPAKTARRPKTTGRRTLPKAKVKAPPKQTFTASHHREEDFKVGLPTIARCWRSFCRRTSRRWSSNKPQSTASISILARPDERRLANSLASSSLKPAEIWPEPPRIGSLITGAMSARPSTRISAFRPTFLDVSSANSRCDDGVIRKATHRLGGALIETDFRMRDFDQQGRGGRDHSRCKHKSSGKSPGAAHYPAAFSAASPSSLPRWSCFSVIRAALPRRPRR